MRSDLLKNYKIYGRRFKSSQKPHFYRTKHTIVLNFSKSIYLSISFKQLWYLYFSIFSSTLRSASHPFHTFYKTVRISIDENSD